VYNVGSTIASEQARGLTSGRVNAVASTTYNRRETGVGAEEESSFFDVAALPLFILADAAALTLIFFGLLVVLQELDVLAKWVKDVYSKVIEQT
jgi:hypothetical protein